MDKSVIWSKEFPLALKESQPKLRISADMTMGDVLKLPLGLDLMIGLIFWSVDFGGNQMAPLLGIKSLSKIQ